MTGQLRLRAGDWVEVRSRDEILATLDENGRLEGMPFMPEMFEHCGRRVRVAASAHKSCDTITPAGGLRVNDAFHLENLRCAGKDYDGCGAACLVFWKGAWLKPADGPGASAPGPAPAPAAGNSARATMENVTRGTRAPAPEDGKGPKYVCQATQLLEASTTLPWWDVRQYVEDYRTGNVPLRRLVEGFFYAIPARVIRMAKHRPRIEKALMDVYDGLQSLWGGTPFPRRRGTIPAGEKTPPCKLDLQPGELVRIKSYKEILATIDWDHRNRGLRYDAELVPYCGGTYRVHSRVNRIIDEKTGRMIEFKNPSLILDGVVCQARYSDRRMMCPRAIYSYWREIWVERVDSAQVPASASATDKAASASASAAASSRAAATSP
jgi:hypothetical protein